MQTYLFNVLRSVEAVPELASEPQLRTRDTSLLDTGSDRIFVSISPCAVNVTVTSLDSMSDSGGSLFLGHLPSAETQLGNLGTVGQGEVGRPSDSRGVHGCDCAAAAIG